MPLVHGATALAINQFASVKMVSVYHQFRLKLEGSIRHWTLESLYILFCMYDRY